jgi:hypothetical protein
VEKLVIAGYGSHAVTLSIENDACTCKHSVAWLEGHLVLHRFTGWAEKGDEAVALRSMALANVLRGLKEKDIYELSMGIITQYGWQLANGAPVLANLKEIGKIHCPQGALYLYDRASLADEASTNPNFVLLRCGQTAERLGKASVRPSNN